MKILKETLYNFTEYLRGVESDLYILYISRVIREADRLCSIIYIFERDRCLYRSFSSALLNVKQPVRHDAL